MIGNELKDLRVINNYTQSQLAKLMGVSISTISSIEKGHRIPDIFILKGYREIFDISIDSLIDENINSQIVLSESEIPKYGRSHIISDSKLEMMEVLKQNRYVYEHLVKFPKQTIDFMEAVLRANEVYNSR